jgi:hypothetical protein
MPDRTFDRVPHFDEKSLEYPIRTLLPEKAPRSYTWRHVQTDQGYEGACVGHGVTGDAAARPKPVFGDPVKAPPAADFINREAYDVYKEAQRIDYWAGEDYEGTSVLAGMKIGQQRGWWSEYRWALGPGGEAAANDVILAIGYKGPVVMGTWWWSGMSVADDQGFIHPTGRKLGGHCYLLTSYSKRMDAVWTPNSWGGAGQGWIKRADLVQLLDDEGEAAIPVVRK